MTSLCISSRTDRSVCGGAVGLFLALALLLRAGAASASEIERAEPGDLGIDAKALAAIDREMSAKIEARDIAGIVALILKDGKIGYAETFGYRVLETGAPMGEDSLFRLQSMTKPVMAAAAMVLVDRGLFTLDEPIANHLPEWTAPLVDEGGKRVPARRPITPRHLMAHASGLYYPGAAPKGVEAREFPSFSLNETGLTLKEHSEGLARLPLKFHPGEGYQYGTSIDVLGRYLEAVTGKPLDRLLRELIFEPLDMRDTDFFVPAEKAARIAHLYAQPAKGELRLGRPPELLLKKPTLFLGGNGLISTARDYARFAQMLLNEGALGGVRVLSPESVRLMIYDNHLPASLGRRYGLGGGNDGKGSYTWGGANGTQFWIDDANETAAIFMVQTLGYRGEAWPVFSRLARQATGAGPEGKPGAEDAP